MGGFLNPMRRLLFGRTFWLIGGLLLLIEAIFLAESFTTLMAIVVSNGGSVWDVFLLLALKSPEVVDFALPIAILIGLYFAITSARDDNELMVCAASGVSWLNIPRFALGVGLLGFVTSILFAGYITPSAKYGLRLAVHYLETKRVVDEITNPAPRNSILEVKGRTVIASPPLDDESARGNLFIFQERPDNGWQASQAQDWDIIGPEDDESYAVSLKRFRDYSGRSGGNAQDSETLGFQLDAARLNISNLSLDFRIEELVEAIDQGRRSHERVIYPLLGANIAQHALDNRPRELSRRVGEVLGRALICLFAAGAAVAVAAWNATKLGKYLALPCGVVVVMVADIVIKPILGDAAVGGGGVFIGLFFTALLVVVLLPNFYVLYRKETMVAPVRGRDA